MCTAVDLVVGLVQGKTYDHGIYTHYLQLSIISYIYFIRCGIDKGCCHYYMIHVNFIRPSNFPAVSQGHHTVLHVTEDLVWRMMCCLRHVKCDHISIIMLRII